MPHRTRIKLCGLSKPADVTHAIDLGADAIGLVFYPPSPRSVSVAQAVELARDVPPFVSVVGLFVNATPDWMREVAATCGLRCCSFTATRRPTSANRSPALRVCLGCARCALRRILSRPIW